MKAEQYLKDIMTKYKNKVVYDANTGEVRDDRKYLSMMEDFWLPRRSDNKSTEITTLPSSAAFDDMSMVQYFEKKLYKALNVPFSRLEQPETPYSIGNSQEISRDEIKFDKYINRLRSKFSDLFDQALKVQCLLKGICTEEEFEEYKQDIYYDFQKDNNYAELKEAELLTNRVNLLGMVDAYKGIYYSKEWIQRHVLNMDDDDIKLIEKQIKQEIADGEYSDPNAALDPTLTAGGTPPSDETPDQSGNDQDQTQDQTQTPAPTQDTDQEGQNPYYGK
jgi:hypothetical protein